MAYKIGEVAKLLGISSETVRYYEREGVIQSQKIDQGSGYRYYEALDINALMRVRMYRNYGFTLQEAKEMLNFCTLEDIAKRLEDKKRELQAAVDWNKRLLACADRMINIHRSASEMLWKCQIEESPGMYRFWYQIQDQLIGDPEIQKRVQIWTEKMPVVMPTPLFAKDDILAGNKNFALGLCVMEEDADFLCLDPQARGMEYVPSQRCIYTAISAQAGELLHCGLFQHVLQYMDAHQLELAGDAIGRTVSTLHRSTTQERIHQVWLPFSKKTSDFSSGGLTLKAL